MSIVALGFALLAATPAAAQPRPGCLAITGGATTVEGRLTRRTFPGPPNYEDVRRGDAAERTYIVTLARDICIGRRRDMADARLPADTVQVYANDAAIRRRLRAAIGQHVRVSGQSFAAETGHHHAPLVMEARRVTILARRH